MSALQLPLFNDPPPIQELPNLDDLPAWNEAERAMCVYDAAFPIEEVPFRNGKILLRLVDDSWLWGVRYRNPLTGDGQCFRPFRKWGPAYAAETREEAIIAACEFLEERL